MPRICVLFVAVAVTVCVCASGSEEVLALIEPEFVSVDDILNRYTLLESAFAEHGDARGIFVAMLRVVTEDAARALDDAYFENAGWTNEFLKSFNNLYREALLEYELGHFDRVPEAWRVAFDAAADTRVSVFTHALLGIHAHVNHDLPFAIAEVAPESERSDRYEDFLRTNTFLIGTIDVIEDLVAQFDPMLSVLDEMLGRMDESLLEDTLTRWRLRSWRTAGRLNLEDSSWRSLWFAAELELRTGRNAHRILGQQSLRVDEDGYRKEIEV